MRKAFTLILFLALTFPNLSFAKMIQIIHTNDLHSYFRGYYDGRGGYPQLKTLIDQLRAHALQQGIESITVDAGDWGEGTSFFFTSSGVNSLRALDLFGMDAVVVGNHDFMLGTPVLLQQIATARIRAPVLAANMNFVPPGSGGLVQPAVTIQRAGLKIKVIGLTTPEIIFQAPIVPKPGKPGGAVVTPPNDIANKLANQARAEGADLIIVATHLGEDVDKKLIQSASNIDAVIGGHSHTRFDTPIFQMDSNQRQVPIVQTGADTLGVGTLVLDVQGPGRVNVVHYQVHNVNNSIPADPSMEALVQKAEKERDEFFGGRWNQVIGTSKISLTGYEDGQAPMKTTCWTQHMARMSRLATGADVGVHLAHFEGVESPAGTITLGQMIDNFPHVDSYSSPGWKLVTISEKGKIIKVILEAFLNVKVAHGLTIDGFTMNNTGWLAHMPAWIQNLFGFKSMLINGKKIEDNKRYSIAFPGGILDSAKELVGPAVKALFPSANETFNGQPVYFWPVMEAYIRANSPIDCLKQ